MALAIPHRPYDTCNMESTSLANQFLIAMPDMTNPYFSHTVSYICEHNEDGAMGFVINRPMGITVGELLEQTEIHYTPSCKNNERQVFFGGPVERERGFVLHSGKPEWSASMPITNNVTITTSLDILGAIGRGEGPESFLLVLGYAGWEPGQLEQEIMDNTWLSSPANTELLFNPDCSDSWQEAASLIGVNLQQLYSQAGHA